MDRKRSTYSSCDFFLFLVKILASEQCVGMLFLLLVPAKKGLNFQQNSSYCAYVLTNSHFIHDNFI